MNKGYKGAITIYLSIILLIFIILTCALIETSRICIAKPEVFCAVNSSAQSLLSEYHTYLKDYYGLFGVKNDRKLDYEGNRFVNRTLNGDYDLPELNPIYNIMRNNRNEQFLNMINYNIDYYSIKFDDQYNLINSNIIDKQIQDYMKYREPYLVTKKVLQQLDVIEEADNTIDIINEKQQLDKKLQTYEEQYEKLIQYIDGINISSKDVVNGFVRQLIKDHINIESFYSNIPDKDIVNRIKNKIIKVDEFKTWINELDNFICEARRLINIDKTLKVLGKREESESKYKALSIEKETLQKLFVIKYGSSSDTDYIDVINSFSDEGIYYFNSLNNILIANRKSSSCIEQLKGMSNNLNKDVDNFIQVLEDNKNNIDKNTYDSFVKDIKLASSKLYNNNNDNNNDKCSISRAKKLIVCNIEILQNFLYCAECINNLDKVIYDSKAKVISIDSKQLYDKLIDLEKLYNNDILLKYNDLADTKTKLSIKQLKNVLHKETDLNKKVENKTNIDKNSNLYFNLPSVIKKYTCRNRIDDIKNSNPFGQINNISNVINQLANMINKQLCLNSYITLKCSNYCSDVNNNYFNNEIEYILHGEFNEKKNVNSAKNKIILMRTALNTIYLYKDTEKRNITFSLASAVCGWWSLGIGSYVTQAIIIQLWSLAEAYVDYYCLINDGYVPLIKDKDDWILDIENLINFNFEQLEKYISNSKEINKRNKETDIDDLNYKDYLYILLLTCPDETKISRLQDLIQLNIIKNWDRDFIFDNYYTRFEVDTLVEYNYLFIKSIRLPYIKYNAEFGY